MVAVRNRFADFGPNVEIAVVTFSEHLHVDRYLTRMHNRFSEAPPVHIPFLLDPDRSAYNAYGIASASTARIYAWRVGMRYRQILKEQGRRALHRPTEDTHQLGGDFVVDPSGVLVYGRWSKGPEDRPPVSHLLGATRMRRNTHLP